MKKFDVYKHPNGKAEAVKHGWNWIAFLFAGFWLPYKKLWWPTYAYWFFIISPITRKWPESVGALASLIVFGMSIYFGLKGYNTIAVKLKKGGYDFAGTFEAETKDAALAAYLKTTQLDSSRRSSTAQTPTEQRPKVYKPSLPATVNKPIAAVPSPVIQTSETGNIASPPVLPQQVPPPLRKDPIATTSLSAAPDDNLLDLNAATEEQLATLPGVGPIFAKKAVSLQKKGGFVSIDHFGEVLDLKSHHIVLIKSLARVTPIQNVQQSNGQSGRVVDF